MGDCVYSLSVPFLEGLLLFYPQTTYLFGLLIISSVLISATIIQTELYL